MCSRGLCGLCTWRFCMYPQASKRRFWFSKTTLLSGFAVFLGKMYLTARGQSRSQCLLPLSSFCPELILVVWWADQVYRKEWWGDYRRIELVLHLLTLKWRFLVQLEEYGLAGKATNFGLEEVEFWTLVMTWPNDVTSLSLSYLISEMGWLYLLPRDIERRYMQALCLEYNSRPINVFKKTECLWDNFALIHNVLSPLKVILW